MSAVQPKVVLDTNNLISAQINRHGPSRQIFRAFLRGEVIIYTSGAQLKEFKRVLSYPRIQERFKFTDADLKQILAKFSRHAVLVSPQDVLRAVPDDPDDDEILAIAVEAKADAIISGDSHLLDLGKYKETPILTAQEFIATN